MNPTHNKTGQKASETKVSTKTDVSTTGPAPTSTSAPVEPSIVAPLVSQETEALPLDNLITSAPRPAEEAEVLGPQPVAVPVVIASPKNTEKATPKVIISISVPAGLARKAKLLAKIEGISLSELFLESAAKEIPVRLKAALETLNDEEILIMEAIVLTPSPTTVVAAKPPTRTLARIIDRFRVMESFHNADLDVRLNTLTMNEAGLIEIPDLGQHLLNEHSRTQLSKVLGFSWERYFEAASVGEQVEEMNHRLARARGFVKLRTTRKTPEETSADGLLRAVVSTSYTPIEDSEIASAIQEALVHVEPDAEVLRAHCGDLTSGFLVRIGEPFEPKKGTPVGAVNGALYVRNSGVAYAKLEVRLMLHRLVCSNGMSLPIAGSTLVAQRHRGMDLSEIWEALRRGLDGIQDRIYQGAVQMASSVELEVEDIEAEVRGILRGAHLPVGLLPGVMAAYDREPHPSRFGVSQALTLAAQGESQEARLALETAAGEYVRRG